ncbi:hypothetical protein [Anabaena catenula]|uniref:PIN domain-containing protein n=1 Tax=Anabaena catenula FACHB-362 TaxID=2692877 RepID=A0ABR8J5E7_9NOST|nr:hypothetical protein [Anabaena catenula]MBD2692356.1 hypothetical protein [Anabaena catenula FACHB-362]
MVAKVNSQRLVIDASVARSAGDKNATFPQSVHCREFLLAVLDICHQIVMTPAIKAEWDKHQSSYARKWRIQMISRKKWNYLEISINDSLWTEIESIAANVSNKRIAEMTKDLCLIEAALATDKIVISLDDNTARKFFSEASIKIDKLKDIVWVNPDKVDEEQPIEWLRNGAKVESDRLLMNYSDKKI